MRALGQMASGIAHDINNAISPVMLYTETLLEQETGLSEHGRSHVLTIQAAAEGVAATVARMREFYRPREPELQLAPVALNPLVGQVLELIRARWRAQTQQRGIMIEIKTELAQELPDIIGAEGEIRDALTNLIFNAVDAMPDGGILAVRTGIAVASGAEDAHVRQAQLTISDSGVGMDAEIRLRCLKPFFTTKGERGTGLGLPMVFGMVQRHSRSIDIDSEVAKGTTVTLRFATLAKSVTPGGARSRGDAGTTSVTYSDRR